MATAALAKSKNSKTRLSVAGPLCCFRTTGATCLVTGNPAVRLYPSMLPLVAYAIFGTRALRVGKIFGLEKPSGPRFGPRAIRSGGVIKAHVASGPIINCCSESLLGREGDLSRHRS